jgi:RNA polymerase sigma factor (sigma-70 family)
MVTDMDNLIAAAQAGDEEALLELLGRCRPQLRRYAYRECASDDVEEAVQDALWLLYQRVGALRAIGAFSSWLFQIVRRECLRRANKRHNQVEWDEEELSTRADEKCGDDDLRIDLTRALSQLPKPYRDVVILRDIGGFSSDETADRLGIPVAAAKSRLHRARQMLRTQLGRRCSGKGVTLCISAIEQSPSIS